MKLHISPCPNDTFTFHAMIHGLVDTEGLEFEVHFDDIDALNRAAQVADGEDIIKVSFAALPGFGDAYRILESGAALGHGNGPLLVSRAVSGELDLRVATIGIPGVGTTANRLLTTLFPQIRASQKRGYLFSEIAPAILRGEIDAGVLIHEGRFTYAAQGLHLIADLGVEWERRTGLPIPLGGILLHRRHGAEVAEQISRIIRRSIRYGWANPSASADFVRAHAQELDDEVRAKHIAYFVNDYSIRLGTLGHQAIEKLLHPL